MLPLNLVKFEIAQTPHSPHCSWYKNLAKKLTIRPKDALKWKNIDENCPYLSYLRPPLVPTIEKNLVGVWVRPPSPL